MITKCCVRSMSGMGISSGCPNIVAAATWCGNWSTLVALKRFLVLSARMNCGRNNDAPTECTVGFPANVATASTPCMRCTVLSPSAAKSSASFQLTGSHRSWIRFIGWRSRSGSSWRSLSATALGQTCPRLNGSSASPRMLVTSVPCVSITSPHIASQSGQACTCRVVGPAAGTNSCVAAGVGAVAVIVLPSPGLLPLGKRVAGAQIATLQSALEPDRTLRARAVRERLGVNGSGGLLLQPVIAHGARGLERFVNVAGIK